MAQERAMSADTAHFIISVTRGVSRPKLVLTQISAMFVFCESDCNAKFDDGRCLQSGVGSTENYNSRAIAEVRVPTAAD